MTQRNISDGKEKMLNNERPLSAGGMSSEGFDADYSKKEMLKSEVKALLAKGEALLKQFKEMASVDDAIDAAANEATGSENHTGFNILVESSAAFQKALSLETKNLNARSGLKRAESLMATERRKLRKMKGLALFRKRYGENWREMMTLDREQSDKDLKEVFDMVDEDGSGLLDREEVALVVEFFAGEKEVSDQDIDGAMDQMDEDGSGEVDFEEFLAWWKNSKKASSPKSVKIVDTNDAKNADKSSRAALSRTDSKRRMQRLSSRDDFDSNLRSIFNRYDDDGSGEIDADELMEIMQNLGVSVTEEEINAMVLEIDEDESGTIDFNEFRTMVSKSMADDSGRSSKLAIAMVEHSFAAMDDEIKYKWARGTIVRLPNGLYAPVFSEANLSSAQDEGAEVPSCEQG
jgi:Ca2+-binding EF-hand superfamily protein